VRATIKVATKAARIIMNRDQPIAEWRVSLWFAVFSPLLGILFGMLALFVFSS
jgi:hypothetical protein